MKTNRSKISSGVYKGRFIELPEIDETRPTKNIVKESVINTLRTDIPYTCFVEVFAGSGSVGIEAISNFSKKVYFLELNKDVVKILKNNLAGLGCDNFEIKIGDSFENIKNITKELLKEGKKAIFYFDPPFNIRENQENIYDKTIATIKTLPADVVQTVVIEHFSAYEFDDFLGVYKKYKKKVFGKTATTYFSVAME